VASIAVLARYVTEYVFGGEKMFGFLFGFYFASAVGLIPLWPLLARRFGKKRMWLFAMAMSALGFGGFLFLREGDIVGMCVLAVILGIGTGCGQILAPSIQADVIDYDEYLTGERKEGAYFATATFLLKSAFGIMVIFAGFALDLIGYQPNVEQTEETKLALRALFGALPLCCYSISIVIFARYFHFSADEHLRIRRVLDERRAAPS
jgi:GPH family glycoside/pentoside/hexuronide:cation symporter